jgi:diguanylate cyclase (GGDEF)-like protein
MDRQGEARRVMPAERLTDWLTDLRGGLAAVLACLLLAALAALDTAASAEYQYGPFYVLPVCIAAWSLGLRGGLAAGLLAAMTWTAVQVGSGFLHEPRAILWNTGTRAACYAIVAVLMSATRRRYDRERLHARTDGLTGALNRRAFPDVVEAMLSRARRAEDVLVLAYLDLDDFKMINDRYGHAAGDHVLATFAQAAAGEAGDGALARVGGDEFVIVQVGRRGDDHFATAEAMHARLTHALDRTATGATCSMGVVVAPGGEAERDALVAAADRLMYEVKRAGKNALRVSFAEDLRKAA